MPTDKEIDGLLSQAIIDTEKEVFGDAFNKEEITLDESGDKSLEAMGNGLEGQHEPAEEDDPEGEESDTDGQREEEGKDPASAKKEGEEEVRKTAEEPQNRDGRVPAGRLREQSERTRAAEAERDALKSQLEAAQAASRKEIDGLNAKFDVLMQALQKQQQAPAPVQQTPAAPEIPDLFEDPKGFAEHMQKSFQAELQRRDQAFENMRVENSLQVAHARHGEIFDAAFEAVKKLDPQNSENREMVRRIYASPNPGEALVQWHKRNEVLRQVGDDPAKYRDQIAAQTRADLMKDPEFRRQIIEELRGEAETGESGRARTITNIPRSLSRAAGNGRADFDRTQLDGSDSAIFETAFRT